MKKFTAMDNNVYLTYFKQEEKPWIENINEFFSRVRELHSDTVINKSTKEYLINYLVSVSNLLNDDFVKRDLKAYVFNKDRKALKKVKPFVGATDPKQLEQIISDAAYLLRRGRYSLKVFEGRSVELRSLIDENLIQLMDCGMKSSKFISKLSEIDAEDSVVLSEIYAIKHKHYSSGSFYSEDEHFFEVKKEIDPHKDMGFYVEHAKDLNVSKA